MSAKNCVVVGYHTTHAPQVFPIGEEKVSKKEAQRIATKLVQEQGFRKAEVAECVLEVNE